MTLDSYHTSQAKTNVATLGIEYPFSIKFLFQV